MEVSDVKRENLLNIRQSTNKIETDIKRLIFDLEVELKQIQKCKEENKDYNVNGRGIIQSSAVSIDTECSRLRALYETKELLDGLK
jgi:hypothetical protein